MIDNSNADPCGEGKSTVRWADRKRKSAQLLGRDAPLPSNTVVHSADPSFISRADGFGCAPQSSAWGVRIAPVVDSTGIATCFTS
jgi:hypothetical protein